MLRHGLPPEHAVVQPVADAMRVSAFESATAQPIRTPPAALS
jgi:hypothetical protein